jgi:hypothetical protein
MPRKVAGIRHIANPNTGQLNSNPVATIRQSRKKVRRKIAKTIVDLSFLGSAILNPRYDAYMAPPVAKSAVKMPPRNPNGAAHHLLIT